jgi:hypothetical protein
MTGDPAKLIMVTWFVVKDGPGAHVLEFTDGQLGLTWGPMPSELTKRFIADRKKKVEEIFDRALERSKTDG